MTLTEHLASARGSLFEFLFAAGYNEKLVHLDFPVPTQGSVKRVDVAAFARAAPMHMTTVTVAGQVLSHGGWQPSVALDAARSTMKLVVAVVQHEDAGVLMDQLVGRGFRATGLHTAGGVCESANATIMLATREEQVDEVFRIIRAHCTTRTQIVTAPTTLPIELFAPYPFEVEIGGAAVFVLPVELLERI